MLKLIKKTGLNVGIAFAFLFATSMIVAQDMGLAPSEDTETVTNNDIHWYLKLGSNDYQYLGTGPTPPGVVCPETGESLCAAGFPEQHDEIDVTDTMADGSPHQRFYE